VVGGGLATHSVFVFKRSAQNLINGSGQVKAEPPQNSNPPLPNLTPKGAGRRGAFREAKRSEGIPNAEHPTTVGPAKRDDVPVKGGGRDYKFNDGKTIREHYEHIYPDDPTQNRGPHINDSKQNHYDYKPKN